MTCRFLKPPEKIKVVTLFSILPCFIFGAVSTVEGAGGKDVVNVSKRYVTTYPRSKINRHTYKIKVPPGGVVGGGR